MYVMMYTIKNDLNIKKGDICKYQHQSLKNVKVEN